MLARRQLLARGACGGAVFNDLLPAIQSITDERRPEKNHKKHSVTHENAHLADAHHRILQHYVLKRIRILLGYAEIREYFQLSRIQL